ncbi:MAG: hypothetical protein QG654_547 [Patescibacteria group bacterium]|nr:hypothetical protein [Patescibacteria group bacterium]
MGNLQILLLAATIALLFFIGTYLMWRKAETEEDSTLNVVDFSPSYEKLKGESDYEKFISYAVLFVTRRSEKEGVVGSKFNRIGVISLMRCSTQDLAKSFSQDFGRVVEFNQKEVIERVVDQMTQEGFLKAEVEESPITA